MVFQQVLYGFRIVRTTQFFGRDLKQTMHFLFPGISHFDSIRNTTQECFINKIRRIQIG